MDNKKKLILGALVAAILAIGAFQFTSGGGDEAPVVAAKEEAQATDTKAQPETLVIEPLPARDPFQPAALASVTQPVPQPTPPPVREVPQPKPLGGDPNWQPINPTVLDPAAMPPAERAFAYVLVGVVSGDTPAAVFADAAGNQRLIVQGGAIDGDSKVLKVDQGKVTIKFGTKTITLSIGGTASAK